MGDGGAMFLGYLMATLGIKLRVENSNHLSAWLAPILILGVTIFDTTLVTISRSRRGLLPFATPGKDHAAHRLCNLGLGHRGAVLTLYLLGAIGGGAAVLVSYLSARMAFFVGALALVVIFAGVERGPRRPACARAGIKTAIRACGPHADCYGALPPPDGSLRPRKHHQRDSALRAFHRRPLGAGCADQARSHH